MNLLKMLLKNAVGMWLMRRRFPHSVIHDGVSVDRDSVLGDRCVLFRGASLVGSSLGSFSYLQSGSSAFNAEIGPYCSIASNVTIGLGAHPISMVSTSPVFYDNEQPLPMFYAKERLFTDILPRTIVGADVWVGQGVMIKAGVKVGVGAIIGAGSVVTKDIPPYTIAAGNPCRPIRMRFSEVICTKLIDTQWWNWNEARLMRLSHAFADPETFLDAVARDIDT